VGSLKVGIIGAGAIGSYVGGMLATGDCDVVFVGRSPLGPAYGAGFVLTDLDGSRRSLERQAIVYFTDAARLADRDVVLCCVKSGQTAAAGKQLAAVLPEAALVVSLQNGVHNAEALRDALPGRIVLAGIVGFNVVPEAHGELRRTTSGPLVIEAHDDPRAAALAVALRRVGFEVKVTREVAAQQWAKLIVNLNNAVSALSNAPTKELLLDAGYRRVLAALMAEAIAVMRRAGVRPGSLTGLPVAWFPHLLRLPTPVLRAVARTQLKIDPDARSSMWEDLSKGRPTEVDSLNGEIVRLAESAGGDAPLNRRMVAMVHDYETKGRGSPALGADALWKELTGAS
jgi:2-dehydropantoate 2-reductase